MLSKPLYLIAGIDRETLASCPATDRLWAAHLGLSLALSFTVVLGITFHASGYVVAEVWARVLVATVVALTVFMFDRALYQSDWFYQGRLWSADDEEGVRAGSWAPFRRFCRIAIRLSISLGLAWVIAVFLELAVFSDTISEKIKRDHIAANQGVFQRIAQYETELAGSIEQQRKSLSELDALYGKELAGGDAITANDHHGEQMRGLDERIGVLSALEERLRAELRDIEAKISAHAEEMNAEELGHRLNPASTGRAGMGPRYEFARRQKALQDARRADLQGRLAQLRAEHDALQVQQRRLSEQAAARREEDRAAAQSRREALRARIEMTRTELRELEASRLERIETFRAKALAASAFQKPKDDPLARMTAYQELKNDAKDGTTITLFSWMTKFLVIFLEIVPVVAKMFFAPPSVYGAKLEAQVKRERSKALLEDREPVDRQGTDDQEQPRPEIDEQWDAPTGIAVAVAQPEPSTAPPRARHKVEGSHDRTATPSEVIGVSVDGWMTDFPAQFVSRAVARERETPAPGPGIEASAFDATDAEFQREWEHLMEVVETANFVASDRTEELEFEGGPRGSTPRGD